MFNGLTDSIKAKLYDFNYTPFMSSFVISWVVINHKYLLILFADGVELREKIGLLNSISFLSDSCLNFFVFPIGFALFYVYIYPLISKKFYEYTLEQTKALKKIKQTNEDETPITREEAREIRVQIDKLTIERDNAVQRAVEVENRYKDKLETELSSKLADITNENYTLRQALEDEKKIREQLTTQLEIQIDEKIHLRDQLQKIDIDDENNTEDDKTKILKYLYESDYSGDILSTILSIIANKTNIRRIVVEKIVNDLIVQKILTVRNGWLYITDEGKEYLVKLFHKQ